jgi:DNA-binding NarL/FixJ family response regulator
VEQVVKVAEKTDKPPKWNILRVNKLSNEGWTDKQIADEYGVSEDTVRVRLMHYRAKQ